MAEENELPEKEGKKKIRFGARSTATLNTTTGVSGVKRMVLPAHGPSYLLRPVGMDLCDGCKRAFDPKELSTRASERFCSECLAALLNHDGG